MMQSSGTSCREDAKSYFSVIASQRVGAERRPMINSATQSMLPSRRYGLLRFRLRSSSYGGQVARNDERAIYAPSLHRSAIRSAIVGP